MKQPKKILFTLFISYAIVMAINLILNWGSYSSGNDWKFSVFFSLSVTTLGVLGGILLSELVFKRFNWTTRPTIKLLAGVLIFAAYGYVIMAITTRAAELVFNRQLQSHEDYVVNIVYAVLISIIIGLIVSGQAFLKQLKKSIEDNEQIKQQMIQSQYETLKNQVNPHFLFNSLNTLTVMIPQQPDVAVRFVEQMAKVFRYSLQHSDESEIKLETELKVVQSYLFLNEQRYEGKLKANINIDEPALQQKIITQSLLMLLENAIKHNEISTAAPLTISVYNEANKLVVCNTLQRKSILEESTRVGLENIKKRYALVSEQPVIIEEENDLFTVKIPLL